MSNSARCNPDDAGLFTEAQLKRLGAVVPVVSLVPVANPAPFHNVSVTNVRLSRPLRPRRWRQGLEIIPFADLYNLFNHAPVAVYPGGGGLLGTFGALNFDYVAAPAGQQASDPDAARGRLNPTRKVMIGVRVAF